MKVWLLWSEKNYIRLVSEYTYTYVNLIINKDKSCPYECKISFYHPKKVLNRLDFKHKIYFGKIGIKIVRWPFVNYKVILYFVKNLLLHDVCFHRNFYQNWFKNEYSLENLAKISWWHSFYGKTERNFFLFPIGDTNQRESGKKEKESNHRERETIRNGEGDIQSSFYVTYVMHVLPLGGTLWEKGRVETWRKSST